MSEQAALAARFERANEAVMAAVERCTDAQWCVVTVAEGWPAGVAAHHIAEAHATIAAIIEALADERPVQFPTGEELDARTARHAVEHADCTREQTLDLLRTNGARAAGLVRGLSGEQLERAGRVVEGVLIRHVEEHGQSVLSVLAPVGIGAA